MNPKQNRLPTPRLNPAMSALSHLVISQPKELLYMLASFFACTEYDIAISWNKVVNATLLLVATSTASAIVIDQHVNV